MPLFEVLAISVVLGTDAFSMALGIGADDVNTRETIRISGVVGLFHVIMPLLGLYLGRFLGAVYDDLAIYFGGGILIFLGLHMFYEHLSPGESANFGLEKTKGPGLLLLALGVSLDSLSVGLSLGTLGTNVGTAALIIGLTALVMTATGLSIGSELGRVVGRHGKLIGGLVLVVLGIRVFFEV